ncbi:MAG TPA: kinase/pyrophosphorylase, partial [Elusimicrobiota bacterium]|nr:kinase/pyrophosphorylase [Elusimicrobiota bacterium]
MAKSLVLISDSTGDLGETFLRSLITQFPDQFFGLKVYSFVDSDEELTKALAEIWQGEPIIFHTTVLPSHKKKIDAFAERNGFPVFDLTGPAVGFLEQVSGVRSRPKQRSASPLDAEYEKRIQALDFAMGHDDGLQTETLEKADIVLVGVSRTSKTPTSIYLAN